MNHMLRSAGIAIGGVALIAGAGAGAAAAAPHGAAHVATGTAHFTISQTNGRGGVVAHGVLNDGGKDASKGQFDHFKMSKGTITVRHPNKQAKFVAHPNKKTCYVPYKVTGKYTITGGTGAYSTISGHGKYVGKGEDIYPHKSSGGCAFKGRPITEVLTVKAHGPTTLG